MKRLLNRLRFEFHQRLKWSRSGYHEKAVGTLAAFDSDQKNAADILKKKYSVSFEERLNFENARDNYFYLDLLDKTRSQFHFEAQHKRVLDIGSKNFYYADALQAFFKPADLMGIEVDGYTIYRDGYSRKDYAHYYIQPHKNTAYEVTDIFTYTGTFELITCFYPFVFPETAVNWSMPLSFFNPENFFKKIESLLSEEGFFWMLNHGEEEWEKAHALLAQTQLKRVGSFTEQNLLSSCDTEACVSLWKLEKN